MTFKFELMDTWKRGVAWADQILEFTEQIPQRYQYSLADQLRRAVLSVPTNLAEGCGRDNARERKYFYGVAKGSIYESVSLLVIAYRRHLMAQNQYHQHYTEANELAAMISGLIKAAEGESTTYKQLAEDTIDYDSNSNSNSLL